MDGNGLILNILKIIYFIILIIDTVNNFILVYRNKLFYSLKPSIWNLTHTLILTYYMHGLLSEIS